MIHPSISHLLPVYRMQENKLSPQIQEHYTVQNQFQKSIQYFSSDPAPIITEFASKIFQDLKGGKSYFNMPEEQLVKTNKPLLFQVYADVSQTSRELIFVLSEGNMKSEL